MTKKYKILQLNSARLYVGEASHTLNLTEALRQAGHTVILGLRKGFPTFEIAKKHGLDPIGFHMPHRWWPPQDLSDLRRIARLVREHKVDLIHAHRGKDHWLAILAVRLFRLRIPVIRTRHVVTPLRDTSANRWQAKRTAHLVAVSRAVEQDVQSKSLYPADRVHRIPGGIDLQRFSSTGRRLATRQRLGLAAHIPVAICVARFAIVKAHRVLVRAWAAVHAAHPDAVLLLVGSGPQKASVTAQVQELGLESSVRFLGRSDNEQIPELLEASDVGLLSSVGSEGFSRAVLEYMALGLPVVATRVGAVPDLIEDGVSGRLVPPEDAEALGAALCEVLAAAPGRRTAWGLAGRSKAAEAHSFPIWAAAHEKLYKVTLE